MITTAKIVRKRLLCKISKYNVDDNHKVLFTTHG